MIKENIVLAETCTMLGKILEREAPDDLEELRLISIRTSPYITSRICHMLADSCHLRKLSLVNAGLSDQNVGELCQMIENALDLVELDISANKMSPERMLELTRVLAENRQL